MILHKKFITVAKISIGLLLPAFMFASCGKNPDFSSNPRNPYGAGPAAPPLSASGARTVDPSELTACGAYAVMGKTGISTTGTTAITGSIAASPVAATYITGFNLIVDASNTFAVSSPHSLVTGNVYAADYTSPTPSNLTTAIGTMETAYTIAAGRSPPDGTELGTGNLGGLTILPGLYKWGTNVIIPTTMFLNGGPNDVWIFQVAGSVNISSAQSITLQGGAQSKNVYWQVAQGVTMQTTSTFVGIILSKTSITMNTGATLLGRAYAQTAVVLNQATITP